ncbi:MAG: bifunctional alpha,alpha-trehalose-phosphate synthase (UDP-forming)/trehalose-phosphatase [Pseudomonadales bacterium]
MQRVLNVANRLPVTIGSTIKKSSGGLVAALEGVSNNHFELQSIGWPGPVEDAAKIGELKQTLESEYGCIPVFLPDELIQGYYHGLSNSSLWPLLHYNRAYMNYSDSDWAAYCHVNELFAEAILEIANDDDIVWVHDYHLFLLPGLLRQARPHLKIGFFLHTPFPSSEVIRCHPQREALIRGVLGADLIGFHTFGYLRHFRSSALQLLGLESDMTEIQIGNHTASLGIFPIGINSGSFEQELCSTDYENTLAAFEENWKGKRLVLSVERLDYSKGLLRRLSAIETFLAGTQNRDDIVFVFVSVPTRGEVKEYQLLRERIEREVGRINGLYASVQNSPIHFIHQSIPFTELCALYSMADVGLVTPLVDGMNLVAKEYLACQDDSDPGVLVLSEFAGAAQELVNAIIVNPYNKVEVANAIDQALNMDLEERQQRMGYMKGRVMQYNADYWARSFIDELMQSNQLHNKPRDLLDDEQMITDALTNHDNVAFFLDYDGTLREFEDKPDDAFPTEELHALLQQLNSSPIDVYIISGRSGETLQEWLGDYDFTLIAEHGNRYLTPDADQWVSLNPDNDFSWKEAVLEVFSLYEGSTPGSSIEEKQSSVVWHYRLSDPVYGGWKANQLLSDMYSMLGNLPVEIHHGKRIVEASSMHVNKGRAVEHFVRKNAYDAVMCAGDDQTDEAMFRITRDNTVSIKVGEGDTHAANRVPDVGQFHLLLQRLTQLIKKKHNSKRTAEL